MFNLFFYYSWGRWREIIGQGQFPEGWRESDVEDCARIMVTTNSSSMKSRFRIFWSSVQWVVGLFMLQYLKALQAIYMINRYAYTEGRAALGNLK